METDEEFQLAQARLKAEGQAALTREERARRRRALTGLDVPSFDAFLAERGVTPLRREPTTILQVNIGLYCNQACSHCHVESSPLKTAEVMSEAVAQRLVRLMDAADGSIKTLDITGGAPELMDQFRPLVRAARERGIAVIDRCNLTVLYEPGQEDLPRSSPITASTSRSPRCRATRGRTRTRRGAGRVPGGRFRPCET